MKKKVVLITGITGMDGSYLAELLLEKGYEVHGIIRRSSSFNTGRIDHIFEKLHLYYGDITDSLCLNNIISKVRPDECYNLAAQSHVQVSFETPQQTGQIDAMGTLNLLEIIKNNCPQCKVYQASTSELFGLVQEIPQKENTPFYPRSPYACSKLYSFWICKNYREAYNMFISNGILFNHESKRRGDTFVTKKIINYVKSIQYNGYENQSLKLGNLDSKRDWGYAPEYVDGMWKILQHDKPDDFILATNETHSIREFINVAFNEIGIIIDWEGKGLEEKGRDSQTGEVLIEIDERYFRPSEVNFLQGDYSKAKQILGWEPKVKFHQLIKLMLED